MRKIYLIIIREFVTRVRKRSFLLMSFVAPLMITGMITLTHDISTTEEQKIKAIAVVDESGLFKYTLAETEWIKFSYPYNEDVEGLQNDFFNSGYYAILHIPVDIAEKLQLQFYSDRKPDHNTLLYIQYEIENKLRSYKLQTNNIEPKIIQSVNAGVNIKPIVFNKDGETDEFLLNKQISIGMMGGMMMYFFIFLFGVQVMKGTLEEKNNRIVEIILSSVKPFQLMMGKIVGIGLTGILQIVLKTIITIILLYTVKTYLMPELSLFSDSQVLSSNFVSSQSYDVFEGVNIPLIIISFVIYFLCGYFLYASLFAAVGAAIDHDSDTQQFILPITLPLLFSVFVLIVTAVDPEHILSKVFSIFPLTSPIIMMSRIPFGVPFYEIVLSLFLLILSFLGVTWLAGKIYKTGILMFGKKVSYKDLWKWIRLK